MGYLNLYGLLMIFKIHLWILDGMLVVYLKSMYGFLMYINGGKLNLYGLLIMIFKIQLWIIDGMLVGYWKST